MVQALIDDLKYEEFVQDIGFHFLCVRVVNFDITHHQCRGSPLANPTEYYETIFIKDFPNDEDCTHNKTLSSAIKSERDNIRLECNLAKSHIKSVNIKKDLESNGFFIKRQENYNIKLLMIVKVKNFSFSFLECYL